MSELIKYPMDLTGTAESNLVVSEYHSLTIRKNRILVPTYGFFYTEGLIIKDQVTGYQLKPNIDFVAAQLMSELTTRTGKEVCAYIVITNPDISNDIIIDEYHVVGGYYQLAVGAIDKLLDALDIDERSIEWGSIVSKPSLFPAGHHFHDIGDVYGFEYLVYALLQLKDAILMGDQALWDDLNDKITALKLAYIAADEIIADSIAAHILDKNNPHNVTVEQIGAATPGDISTAVTALSNSINQTLNEMKAVTSAHLQDKNNPHGVTVTQIGAATPADITTAVNALRAAVNLSLNEMQTLMNNHISARNNPHNVTATQLGVYTIAAMDQALGMLTQSINTLNVNLNGHVDRRDNPHGVTAAQIGAITSTQLEERIAQLDLAKLKITIIPTIYRKWNVLSMLQAGTLQPNTGSFNNYYLPDGELMTLVGDQTYDSKVYYDLKLANGVLQMTATTYQGINWASTDCTSQCQCTVCSTCDCSGSTCE